MAARTIWRLGDPWRDLADELSAGVRTVVTSSLAAHILIDGRFHTQRTGSHRMLLDGQRQRLDQIEYANPCGMRLRGPEPGTWHESTPLVLVLDGDIPDWKDHPAWPTVERAVKTGWNLTGHPTSPCRARHCRWTATDPEHQIDNQTG